MMRMLRRAWEGWKRVAHWIGHKQAILTYTLLYVVMVGPAALVHRVIADPFQYRKRRSPSFWVPRLEPPATLEVARRQ